jgi:hypothetical protein
MKVFKGRLYLGPSKYAKGPLQQVLERFSSTQNSAWESENLQQEAESGISGWKLQGKERSG